MKKFVLAAVTLALISSASFAEQNTEIERKMSGMRQEFMAMTEQMIEGQMEMMKMNEAILTNYQRVLKQMMESNQGNKK
ncbi:MAG: hypothetical protein ABI705_03845 [Aestuariivirga sp.]